MPVENENVFEQVQEQLPEEEQSPFRERTRGKSRYIRKALTYVFGLSKEEIEKFEPRNGYEEAALALRHRCALSGTAGNAAFSTLRDSLGEKVREENTGKAAGGPGLTVLDDLPRRKLMN